MSSSARDYGFIPFTEDETASSLPEIFVDRADRRSGLAITPLTAKGRVENKLS